MFTKSFLPHYELARGGFQIQFGWLEGSLHPEVSRAASQPGGLLRCGHHLTLELYGTPP